MLYTHVCQDPASILDFLLVSLPQPSTTHFLRPPLETMPDGSLGRTNAVGGQTRSYHLIDFGLSRQYSSRNAFDEPLRGGDKYEPKHQHRRLRNPFHANIYHIGVTDLTLLYSSPHILTPPDNLHPSLSCWIKNMNQLSSLIDRLHKLASAAPAEHRSQLLRQVVALRAMFKRQQERFIEFLQLSEEFADKYLLDISADIQQQSTVLNNLEERLEAAKKLHEEATDLKTFYESGTVDTMKNLRASGKAVHCCLQRQNTQNFYLQ